MSDEHVTESEGGVSDVDELPQKRRKGIRNDEKYKKNVIKRARIEGTAYVNHRDREVLAKQQGPPCR